MSTFLSDTNVDERLAISTVHVLEHDRGLVDVEETAERRVRDPRGAPRRPEQAPSEESGRVIAWYAVVEPSLKGQTESDSQ